MFYDIFFAVMLMVMLGTLLFMSFNDVDDYCGIFFKIAIGTLSMVLLIGECVHLKYYIPYYRNFSVNGKSQVIGLSKGNNNTEIEIPDISKGVKTNAFSGRKNIEKVILPEGIEVEPRAFIGCSNLKEIEISSNIPLEAFKFCPNLTTVTVPDIGHSVFVGDYEFLPNGSSVVPENMRIELSN